MNINIKFICFIALSVALSYASSTAATNAKDVRAKNINTEEVAKPLTQEQKNTPLARALAQSKNISAENSFNEDKTLNLDITELKDNSGLVYLGGKVSAADLNVYLAQMKTELGESQFTVFRQHQAARDQQTFHVTLVNPYEYQTINKANFESPGQFRVVLHGLGRVEFDDKKTYFVVASSPDGQFIRQGLLLNNKDFHVTLGFYPQDIYGVSKSRDTLIKH